MNDEHPLANRVVKIATNLIGNSEKIKQRTSREARALETCEGLRIPKVYSHSVDGTPFIVEEYLEGRTLLGGRSIFG